MRELPDFNAELSQVCDYILSTEIAKKAIEDPPFNLFTNMVNDILESIDKLADNCHMPEFTNHALPHICSVIKRASDWGQSDEWLNRISSKEAAYLLIAIIIHDIGMVSQAPEDLPDEEIINSRKGLSNISEWTRRTHVIRIKKLIYKILKNYEYDTNELDCHLSIISEMAGSHSYWPWNDKFRCNEDITKKLGLNTQVIEALSSIIAVVDLLDEDSNRCDTATLIKHRYGSVSNIAHWLRHSLTIEVLGVKHSKITVKFRNLYNVPQEFEYVFKALRNHYRLVMIYNEKLKYIGADIKEIEFLPDRNMPTLLDEVSEELKVWQNNIEFKYCITEQILRTFMDEVFNITSDETARENLDIIEMEFIDINKFSDFLFPSKPLTMEERIVEKILKA